MRLPASWEGCLDDLLRAEQFNPYLDQDDQRPWFIGQWLAIEAGDEGDLTAWVSPHLRIQDDAVLSSVLRGSEVGAVIVFIECNGRLCWTGYPINEGLIGCLQAGGVASCRNPLFEFTVAHLQAQVRALIEGNAPAPLSTMLTLSVTSLRRDIEEPDSPSNVQSCLGAGVNSTWYYHGAMGLLRTVSDYVPDELSDDPRLWLKLTVPDDLWEKLVEGVASVDVAKLPEVDGHKAVVRVTVTGAQVMFEAYLDATDACLGSLLDAYAAQGRCPIAFEAFQSGYLHAVEVDWPDECGSDELQEMKQLDGRSIPRTHPDTEMRARFLTKDKLNLYTCNVLDARRWQAQQRRMARCDVPIGCSPGRFWETGVTTLQDSQKGRPGEQSQECQIDR